MGACGVVADDARCDGFVLAFSWLADSQTGSGKGVDEYLPCFSAEGVRFLADGECEVKFFEV